jgi:nucleoside-diphosphate-sugar epimerase
MAPRSVLVTGMSGLIGGALRRHLEGKYVLSALNRQPLPGVKCHRADIADLAAIAPAFEGVDTVVHLAARTGSSESFDEILGANVIGTYNVFEAARRAGVGRVIFASSGATVSAWERDSRR